MLARAASLFEVSLLKDKIKQDLNKSLKNRAAVAVSVDRMLLSDIHNQEIRKKTELTEEEILSLLSNSVKRHEDSIKQFRSGARADLVAKEQAELAIVKTFLPEQLPPAELKKVIEEVIAMLRAPGTQPLRLCKATTALLTSAPAPCVGRDREIRLMLGAMEQCFD